MSSEPEAFREAASRFCSLIDTVEAISGDDLHGALHRSLADVYAAATRMRPSFIDEEDEPGLSVQEKVDLERDARERIEARLGDDAYSFVFDPWEDRDIIQSTIAQDLAEVYGDLKDVLDDHRSTESAAWDWREAFDIHWGRHAAQALHALHWHVPKGG